MTQNQSKLDRSVRNPHTSRQDAETWKRLYEKQISKSIALEKACIQAAGALRLDAMVDANGLFYGTTIVALETISIALQAGQP